MAFPIIFLMHDFEVIIFVESWFEKNYSRVEPKVPKRMKKVFRDLSETTAARFSIPVFMQFIVYIIATFLVVEKDFYHLFLGLKVCSLISSPFYPCRSISIFGDLRAWSRKCLAYNTAVFFILILSITNGKYH
ncbi:HXXEE domain-containing protein [Bacillus sp. FJAT-49711]|uniref:HXXEE domain-containing protein n=1 Tax=Bacillus sp. FJAT-49711 TaxID=2833585 RepID=UPI001BCA0492|nr:HXXEE domain-containing protein [Bacillus sp. FJAT-49711]MBS4218475.1 HXXEE domain-containing protein [Bacillus sp. FJAT-49711]